MDLSLKKAYSSTHSRPHVLLSNYVCYKVEDFFFLMVLVQELSQHVLNGPLGKTFLICLS